jgi:hypothetical protein
MEEDMPSKPRKLALNRETIREISGDDLAMAVSGQVPTVSCPLVCRITDPHYGVCLVTQDSTC